MATERLPMRKTKEILRQKWLQGRRHRQIARALGVGVGTVSSVVMRAADAELTWEQVEALSEEAAKLERELLEATEVRDSARISLLSKERARVASSIAAAEAAWMRATEQLEAQQAD